jgi:hypothetical protein
MTMKKSKQRVGVPFTWTAKVGSKIRLEYNSAGYVVLDKDGRVMATFGPTDFGAALREWHRLTEADKAV